MRNFALVILIALFFTPACANRKPTQEKSIPALRKMLDPNLTKDQLIAKWGQPDARGSGRDLLYYDLPDGDRVTFFYIDGKLVGVHHKGGTIVEYPRTE